MSNETVETFVVGKCRVRIEYDTNPQSPSEWGDDGLFIVANHRDFYVPEPGQKRVPSDPDEVVENWKKTHWIFPLEAYIHSGVHLSFGQEGGYPDRRWDVSQLGFVFASKKEWRLSKKAREAAASKIAEWNRYLSGQIYGYVVETNAKDEDGEDVEGEHLDSRWGIDDLEYAKSEARGIAEHHSKEIEDEERETELALVWP